MILETDGEFDIELTLNSGQFFHWFDSGNLSGSAGPKSREFSVLHRQSVLHLRQVSPMKIDLNIEGVTLSQQQVKGFLGLKTERNEILGLIQRDPGLKQLADLYRGLTILRQDPYECLISFMTSGMSNIPRIRRNLRDLRRGLGTPIKGTKYHSLPSAHVIADAGESALRRLGFGYRAKYIVQTCRILTWAHPVFPAQENLSDAKIVNWLLGLPGVGQKIANCVLLFGFGRLAAFPVDVWVRRGLESLWPGEGSRSPVEWSRWATERWGSAAGYVQQILFCEARNR